MRRMVDAFAEYERLIIGARTKAALQVKKRKGERVGHIPYGFKLAENKIHLEENAQEQYNLNMINRMRSQGMTFRKIAEEMNSFRRFNREGPWNHVAIKRVRK